MPRVFVVQENQNLSFIDAERYGKLVFLTCDEFRSTSGSLFNSRIVSDVTTKMAEFDPDTDFLLPVGNPIVIGYAMSIALSKKGYVSVLMYQRASRTYHPVVFHPSLLLDMSKGSLEHES